MVFLLPELLKVRNVELLKTRMAFEVLYLYKYHEFPHYIMFLVKTPSLVVGPTMAGFQS